MVRQLKRTALRTRPGRAALPRPLSALHLRLADHHALAVASPARQLQDGLERAIQDDMAGRWSARRALTFTVVSSGLMWAGLILAARSIF